MSYNVKEWHDRLTVRRGIKLDIPSATEVRDGYGSYYVYDSCQDAAYMRACRLAIENSDTEARVREKLRARRAAKLFEEMWNRRLAGESLDEIEGGEEAA